ncbi:uncharacterized protein LOC133172183 [Saccostrea echinata]|uniref:uncharacterized protein LOC133172183 n=1 Tax=Saccostrea echinata TaxID=191078 RepID=UPI002A80D0AA|nr:uncharacterized protein LOC133172183 [Saccostrea echinata]
MAAFASLLFAGLSVSLIPGTVPQCCPPLQFQTYLDTLVSLSSLNDKRFKTMMYSYDAKSRRTATHVVTESKEDEYDRIDDYAANKSYEWAKGVCYVSATGPYNQTCIPARAKLVRQSFMGVSPNTIKVDTYMFMVGSLTRLLTVGPKCTPVEYVQATSEIPQPDGQYMWIFYNTTMGIKDASIFTPPKICFKTGTRVEKRPDALPHLTPF